MLTGAFPNCTGGYSPLPGAAKLQYMQMEVLESKGFEEKKKEFGKLFIK